MDTEEKWRRQLFREKNASDCTSPIKLWRETGKVYSSIDTTQFWLSCSIFPLFFLLAHTSETITSTSSPAFPSLRTPQLLNISPPCAAWTHIHETKKTSPGTDWEASEIPVSKWFQNLQQKRGLAAMGPNSAFAPPCAYGTDFQDLLQVGAGSAPEQEMKGDHMSHRPVYKVTGPQTPADSSLQHCSCSQINRKAHTNTFCLELSLFSLLAQKCLCRIWDPFLWKAGSL